MKSKLQQVMRLHIGVLHSPLGVVMDFSRLRGYLAGAAKGNGCEVFMGYRFAEFQPVGSRISVRMELPDKIETDQASS